MSYLRVPKSQLDLYEGEFVKWDDIDKGPCVSVTKSGRRWFWVGYQSTGDLIDGQFMEGYAATREQAIVDGKKAVGHRDHDWFPSYTLFRIDPKKSYVTLSTIRKDELARLHGVGPSQRAQQVGKGIGGAGGQCSICASCAD